MKCPNCQGDLESFQLRNPAGFMVKSKRCNQCQGFWFENDGYEQVSPAAASKVDAAAASYTLQENNFICPIDQTSMGEVNADSRALGIRYWRCPDCHGAFLPRGQLAAITVWREGLDKNTGQPWRSKIAEAVVLISAGLFFTVAAIRAEVQLMATPTDPLPNVGPNIVALILLAVTYLAGTTLAVLGRKVPVIVMGWGVIAICLFGFSVVIFGP